ncbi:DNA gyrase subunit A [subsurface metagenome]
MVAIPTAIPEEPLSKRLGRAEGRIVGSSKVNTEELERGRSALIITELPYEVNKSTLIENIANLVSDKKIEGISNIRDESDKKGMRVCIELKAGENSEVVLNQLYKHTALRTSFGIINLALVKNRPRVLSLVELLGYYLEHRREVVRRRTQFNLKKAENRAHILAGLKIALLHIEQVIKIIRKSSSVEVAKSSLMKNFKLSSLQTDNILSMPLSRLTKLERDKIDNEYKELTKEIKRFKIILADEKKILVVIKNELEETRKRFGDKRRTKIIAPIGELVDIDFIKEENVVVTVSAAGYVKRLPAETYRRQHRGGRGIIGAGTKEEDYIKHFFVASTHDTVLSFTNKGKVYWLPAYRIPEASRQSKGKAVINLLKISTEETITAIIPLKEYSENLFLLMVTKKGIVKKTSVSAYSHQRQNGIIALTLKENDELIEVKLTDGNKNIILSTKEGKSIHFAESDTRSMGRTASGVRGIRLTNEDVVRGAEIAEENHFLLTITANGYGKRSKIKFYRKQKRGGKGVIDIKTAGRNGEVISVKSVEDDDEIMLITTKGILIRVPIRDIRAIGRNTQGVKLINLEKGDHIADSALVLKEKEGIPNLQSQGEK